MTIKRRIAKVKIKIRKHKAEKHQREMKRLGIARNKALKEAEMASEKATAHEARRKAEEKRARALAPLEKEKRLAQEKRKKEAKKAIKSTVKALKPLYKIIKGK